MAAPTIRFDFLYFNDSSITVDWYGFRVLIWNIPEHRPGLYLIVNLVNGKIYIGIGEDVFRRLRAHAKFNSPKALKAAIRKYGKPAFLVMPLYYSTDGTNGLEMIEADLISEHDAINRGYNICAAKGRVGPYGPAHGAAVRVGRTEEGKARQAASARALYPQMAEKLHAAQKAAANSPEGKAAASARSKAQWQDPEMRQRMIEGNRKAHVGKTAEISARVKATWVGADERRKRTAETLAKAIAADPDIMRRKWEDPERRRQAGERLTASRILAAKKRREEREAKASAIQGELELLPPHDKAQRNR